MTFFWISMSFLVGAVFGAVWTLWASKQPTDRTVVEIGVKKQLNTDDFIPFEDLYFRLELTPKDILTLRHVLEMYEEEGVIIYTKMGPNGAYKLPLHVLA